MTPFGARVRQLRAERGLSLKDMAEALGVSASYLSALERGKRGKPTFAMIQATIHYFNIIWDEAEALQRLVDLSDPRITIDTAKLSPKATEFTNRLAKSIADLDENTLETMLSLLDHGPAKPGA